MRAFSFALRHAANYNCRSTYIIPGKFDFRLDFTIRNRVTLFLLLFFFTRKIMIDHETKRTRFREKVIDPPYYTGLGMYIAVVNKLRKHLHQTKNVLIFIAANLITKI